MGMVHMYANNGVTQLLDAQTCEGGSASRGVLAVVSHQGVGSIAIYVVCSCDIHGIKRGCN